MIKHFSKQIIVFLACSMAVFSTGYAQEGGSTFTSGSAYTGGNEVDLEGVCLEVTNLVGTDGFYMSGNSVPAASICRLGQFNSRPIQTRDACYGENAGGAQFRVEMTLTGQYVFWWKSKGGDKNQPEAWGERVAMTARTFYTIPATGDRNDGPAKSDKWLYVYNGEAVDSIDIDVRTVAELNPGEFDVAEDKDTICFGGTADMITPTAVEGGAGFYTYEWWVKKDGGEAEMVDGATGANYTPGTYYANNAGTYTFTRKVRDGGCGEGETGGYYELFVYTPFSPGEITDNTNEPEEVCQGGSVPEIVGTTPASGANEEDIRYQWYKDGVAIANATGANYTPGAEDTKVQNPDGYTIVYTRKAYDTECHTEETASTGSFVVEVTPSNIRVNVTANPTAVAYEGTTNLIATISNSASAEAYEWQVSTTGGADWTTIEDVTTNSYSSTNMTVTTQFRATAKAVGGCVYLYGEKAVVEVYKPWSAGTITTGSENACTNATVTTVLGNVTAPTGGSGSYTYQWYTNDGQTSISGATAATYSPGAAYQGVGVYTFNRKVTDNNTGETGFSAGTYTLRVTSVPVISGITGVPVGAQCYGYAGTTLNVAGTGMDGAEYIWEKSTGNTGIWTKLSEATGSVTTGVLNDTTVFRVKVRRSAGEFACESPWAEATINVHDALNAGTVDNTTLTIVAGAAVPQLITATAPTGGDPGVYTYRWSRNNSPISDGQGGGEAQLDLHKISAVANNDVSGIYTRAVTNSCGIQGSQGAYTIVVSSCETIKDVKIDVTPATVETKEGATVTLTATNVAGAVYTWKSSEDGINYNTTLTDNGTYMYTPTITTSPAYFKAEAVISGDCAASLGSGTAATVTFPSVPFSPGSITAHELTACEGVISMHITGTVPSGGQDSYTYQWQVNGKDIQGANAINYENTAYVFDEGVYTFTRVVTDVASGLREVSANEYKVTVSAKATALTIMSSVNDAVCYGANNGTINVTTGNIAEGSVYTWEQSVDGGVTWLQAKDDAQDGTYNFENLLTTTAFRVKVSRNGVCEVISKAVTITVAGKLDGGAIENTTYLACPFSNVQTIGSVRDANGGSGNISYRWYRVDNNTPIFGATAATYTPNQTDLNQTGTIRYTRAAVDPVCGTAPAAGTYTINVLEAATVPSTILILTAPDRALPGTEVTLTATNIAGATYTWQEVDMTTMAIKKTLDSKTFRTTMELPEPGPWMYQVTAKITNNCGLNNVTTPIAVRQIQLYEEALNGGALEAGTTVCVGSPATATGTPATGGDGVYTYEWSVNGRFEVETRTSFYVVADRYTSTPGIYNITRKVKDSHGNTANINDVYTLTVTAPPALGTISVSATPVCLGGEVVLSVADLDATTYTWYSSPADGNLWTPEKTGNGSYTITVKVAGDSKYRVSAQQTGVCSASTADTVLVATYAPFVAGEIENGTLIVCEGTVLQQPIQSIHPGTGGNPAAAITYQWYKDGGKINGATGATLIPSGIGTYTREDLRACGTATMAKGRFVIDEVEAVGGTTIKIDEPLSRRVTSGTREVLTATNVAGAEYTWESRFDDVSSSWTEVLGQTGYRLVTEPVTTAMFYRVSAEMKSGNCTGQQLTSDRAATLTVYDELNAGAITTGGELTCEGSDAKMMINETTPDGPAGGNGQYTYRWRVNGTLIPAENEPGAYYSAHYLVPRAMYMTNGPGEYRFTREVTSAGQTRVSDGAYVVTVQATPAVSITASNNDYLCNTNSGVILTATATGATSGYTWEYYEGGAWTPVPGSDARQYNTGALTATRDIRVTVSNEACGSVTDTYTVNVALPLDAGAIYSTTYTTCPQGGQQTIISERDPQGGSGNFRYVWYKNGGMWQMNEDAEYTPDITDFSTIGTVTYTRGVVDLTCNSKVDVPSAGSYTIVVVADGYMPSTISAWANPAAVYAGSTVTLTASNIAGAKYKWEAKSTESPNFVTVDNVDTYYYTPTVNAASTYQVTATIINACNQHLTASATVTVGMYTAINAGAINGGSAEICAGSGHTVQNNTLASGGVEGGTLTYHWYVNDEYVRSTGNTPSYSVDAKYTSRPGMYVIRRQVRDGNGGVAWSTGTRTLYVEQRPAVSISSSFEDMECTGVVGELIAHVSSDNIITSYIWQQRSSEEEEWADFASGTTASTYIKLEQTKDVQVIVTTNVCRNGVASSPLTLQVYPALNVGSVPSMTYTLCANGQPVEIDATPATGGNTPVYEWSKDGNAIPNTNVVDYTPAPEGTAGIHTYTRKVKDGCSSFTATPGTYVLDVMEQPEVTLSVATSKVSVGCGTTYTATVLPVRVGVYTYEWYYNNNPVVSGTPRNAVYTKNGNSMIVSGIAEIGNHDYTAYVTATNDCAPAIAMATLQVVAVPVITITPNTTAIDKGTTQTLTATIDGAQGDVAWQTWEYSAEGTEWNDIVGLVPVGVTYSSKTEGTKSELIITSQDIPTETTVYYRVKGLDAGLQSCGMVMSAPATVTFIPQVEAGEVVTYDDMHSVEVCGSTSVDLKLVNQENESRVVQWERMTNEAGSVWTRVDTISKTAHYTTDPLVVPAGVKNIQYYYRAVVSKASSPDVLNRSTPATITVNATPSGGMINRVIDGHATPVGAAVEFCPNVPDTLTVTNVVGVPVWEYKEADDSTAVYQPWTNASVAGDTAFVTLAGGVYDFRVVVTNGTNNTCAPAYSKPVTVTVLQVVTDIKLSIKDHEDSEIDLCAGNPLVLTHSKLPSVGTLTWERKADTDTTDWGPAQGNYMSSTQEFRITTTPTGRYLYRLVYRDACQTVYSSLITAAYSESPTGGVLETDAAELCEGGSAVLTLKGMGEGDEGETRVAAWEVLRPGDTTFTSMNYTGTDPYTVTPDTYGEWIYRVRVINEGMVSVCQQTYSSEIMITSYPRPKVELASASFTVCDGTEVEYTFTGTPDAKFEWVREVTGGELPTESGVVRGEGRISQTLINQTTSPMTVTYTVTPKIGAGITCEGTPVTITYALWPKPDIKIDRANSKFILICSGDQDGVIAVTPLSSTTYTLHDATTGELLYTNTAGSFTALNVGDYEVRAVNAGLCTMSLKQSIRRGESAVKIAAVTATNVSCNGEANGRIQLTVTGYSNGYTVSMNGGAPSTMTLYEGLRARSYNFRATDGAGCSHDTTVTLTEPERLAIKVTSVTGVSAAGARDAKATLEVTGGTKPYGYSLTGNSNDYSANSTVSGLTEGENTVYVRDANGCAGSVMAAVSPFTGAGISLSAVVTRPLTCPGVADAEVTVTAFGGKAPYSYSTNGETFVTTNLITSLSDGIHTIWVKDNSGGTVSANVTIAAAAPITLEAVVTQPANALGENAKISLLANGGTKVYQYSKNGEYTSAIGGAYEYAGLQAGTYSFVARDNSNMQCLSPEVVVSIPAATITPVILTAYVSKHATCNTTGEVTVIATNGVNPYQFYLNGVLQGTHAQKLVIGNLAPAAYEVYAIDIETKHSDTITIEVLNLSEAPVIENITVDQLSSCNLSNARITINATGGYGALQYSIDGVRWVASSSIGNLAAGFYNVFVRDQRGCVTSSTITVGKTAETPLTFEITGITSATANGAADGTVSVAAYGGRAPYQFTLTPGNSVETSNTYTFTGLRANTYQVSVADADKCATLISHVVVGDGPDAGTPGTVTLSAYYTTKDLTCADAPTGEIHVSAMGGSGTYQYSLDNKLYQDLKDFTGLYAGVYTIYVRDTENNRATIFDIVINAPMPLTVDATVSRGVSVAGASDAEVMITAANGTAPYTYAFNNDNFVQDGLFRGVPAGNYVIRAKDFNGCMAEGYIMISDPIVSPTDPDNPISVPSITASVEQHVTCYGANDGIIHVAASGDKPPYTFSVDQMRWYSGNRIPGLTATPAGTRYTVYAKDQTGLVFEGPAVTLRSPEKLVLTVESISPVTVLGGSDGQITLSAKGGTVPYSYSINLGENYQSSATFTDLTVSRYTAVVKDRKGCTTSRTVAVAGPADPQAPAKISFTVGVTTPVSCYGNSDGVVTVYAVPAGADETFQYASDVNRNWVGNNVLTGFNGGVHMIYVRNNSNVEDSMEVFIPQPINLAVAVKAVQLPTGSEANGVIGVTVVGGSGNYTYEISGRSTTYSLPLIGGLVAGDYTITVRDAVTKCATVIDYRLKSVDLVTSVTELHLKKGTTNELKYTLRLTTQPESSVYVNIESLNPDLIELSTAQVTFTTTNWDQDQEHEITVRIKATGIDPNAMFEDIISTTEIVHSVASTSDASYAGIVRYVAVEVTDDGSVNCTGFEQPIMELNGNADKTPIGAIGGNMWGICSSGAPWELVANADGAISYEFRLNGMKVLRNSSINGAILTESGTYTVTARSAIGCERTSVPMVVVLEEVPAAPRILGSRSSLPGEERRYRVETPSEAVRYDWTLPVAPGYSLISATKDNTDNITIKVGDISALLQLHATNRFGNYCPAVTVSCPIDVVASADVALYPTAVSDGTPIHITPKDMTISSILVINANAQYFSFTGWNGELVEPDEQVTIYLGNVDGGHYFVILRGTKGERVIKRIIKN